MAAAVALGLILPVGTTARAELIHVPDDYPTIQEAINASADGDEIIVAPGTYNETIDLLGKAVTLRAVNLAVELDDPLDPTEASIIDGDDAYCHIVTCVSGEGLDTTIDGFAIVDGMADGASADGQGGGLYILAASPTVTHCYFTSNWAVTGGAIFAQDSNVEITSCIFKSNEAKTGAGMANRGGAPTISDCGFMGNLAWYSGGGMDNVNSSPSVTGCTFTDNWYGVYGSGNGGGMHNVGGSPVISGCTFSGAVAGNSGFYGGGMYNGITTVTIEDCTFTDNHADYFGGGMHNENATAAIENCTFTDNEADDAGGGMSNAWGGTVTVVDCTFENNEVTSDSTPMGGGMYNLNAITELSGCTFIGNLAPGSWDRFGQGGAMFNAGESEISARDCTFTDNWARECGGVYNNNSTVEIIGCQFIHNTSDEEETGAAMHNTDCSPLITNCAFLGNAATITGAFTRAGGIYNAGGCNPVITNCIFSCNLGYLAGAIHGGAPLVVNCAFSGNVGVQFNAVSGSGTVVDAIVRGNGADYNHPDIDPAATVTYSNVEEGFAGEGNIDADPLFVRTADVGPDGMPGSDDDDYGDLRLQAGSPCIDAADNDAVPADVHDLDEDDDTEEPIPFDLDWNPRFVDDPDTEDTGQGDPPVVDMGAYEFQVNDCPADFDGDGDVDTVDLLFLLGAWGTPDGDVDGDGDTDTADLLVLLGAWGECP